MGYEFLTFSIIVAFIMGMVAYRMMQLIIRHIMAPRPRYRRTMR